MTNHQTTPAWFCVRTHSKHEHIAAGWIERCFGLEVYAPRVRFRRPLRRGRVWFTEALFPNYLFARFELATWIDKVSAVPGVLRVVHFGKQWPAVPDETLDGLRAQAGSDQVHVIDNQFKPGDAVELAAGAFYGLEAVVTSVMPGRERVAVLLDFLGRQTLLELPSSALSPTADTRARLFH